MRAACGHAVQTGSLMRSTGVWQRQRMLEGISGTQERPLQVPQRSNKNYKLLA